MIPIQVRKEGPDALCVACMLQSLILLFLNIGNLLRTPDGRLCILDWGMVTRLDGDLQLTLIEHMAHLTSADYEEIPRDLLLLGFIPKEKAGAIDDSGVVEVLADIYGAWTSGGVSLSVHIVPNAFNTLSHAHDVSPFDDAGSKIRQRE